MLMQIPTPTASELMELVGTTRPPWIVFALKESIPSIEDHLASRRGFTRIELDGAAMRNLDTYWHELMNKFAFPNYFGKNLHALYDCLTDADVLPSLGYLVVLRKYEQLLIEGKDGDGQAFLDTFMRAAEERSVPIRDGAPWDREATPFHLLLELEANKVGADKF
jgi:hypothetical protein